MRIYCFEPIINSKSEILVLGTLPGTESLKRHEYYAEPRNQFWDIIYSIYSKPSSIIYEQRCGILLEQKLALWDVLESAERVGASDNKIKNEIPNDFKAFLSSFPGIKHIIFSGTKPEYYFKKYYKDLYESLSWSRVSSTSPTPGQYVKTPKEKKRQWEATIMRNKR